MWQSMAACTRASLMPGDSAKRAPASCTCCISAARVTVPAPTCICGTCLATASMAAKPALWRSVISITSMPPASSACAIGTACDTSLMTMTGTTRDLKTGRWKVGWFMWAFNSASMTTKATRLLRPRRRCVETNQTSLGHCPSLQRGVVDAVARPALRRSVQASVLASRN